MDDPLDPSETPLWDPPWTPGTSLDPPGTLLHPHHTNLYKKKLTV